MYILLTVLGLIIIAVICVIIAAVKKNSLNASADNIETEKKEELTLADIVSFFKRPEVTKKLKSSEDLIGVALREKKDDGTNSVTVCLYDKKNTAVRKSLKCFVADKLSDDLLSTFGNKDMIVLE